MLGRSEDGLEGATPERLRRRRRPRVDQLVDSLCPKGGGRKRSPKPASVRVRSRGDGELAQRTTLVGGDIAVLSAGTASRAPRMVAMAWKVTLPRAASSLVNV